MDQLSAKTVDHADRTGFVSVEQRRSLIDDRQVFVYQQTLVDHVDLKAAEKKFPVIELKFMWRADDGVVTPIFEVIAEQFELLLRR